MGFSQSRAPLKVICVSDSSLRPLGKLFTAVSTAVGPLHYSWDASSALTDMRWHVNMQVQHVPRGKLNIQQTMLTG
jgi:hypothetical protein